MCVCVCVCVCVCFDFHRYCGQKGQIPYFYLPLRHKIEQWCQDKNQCIKMTAHWNEKEHWLGVLGGWNPKKEIWDGKRFGEMSWFWDPNAKWTLPCRCLQCSMIVSAATIDEAISHCWAAKSCVEIQCQECHHIFDHEPKFAHGDPRNIALIGHWDGWQPFSTSGKHGCGKLSVLIFILFVLVYVILSHLQGAIEVSIATMKKADRCKVDEVYVVGFVPSYILPKKRPITLDPFLHPLMEEIEDLFINGKYKVVVLV